MQGVVSKVTDMDKLLQPTAQQMGRVQRDEYVEYVSKRNILQPAARQVERLQRDEYEMDVLGRRILQPAAQLGRIVSAAVSRQGGLGWF